MAGFFVKLIASIPFLFGWLILTRGPFMMASTAPSSAKPWADEPMKLIKSPQYLTKKTDLFTAGASHMCNLHNSILRGYNSIYQQAEYVQDADKADFVGYALTWHKFVKTHHDDEEETLFTKVEALLKDEEVFKATHDEHQAFLPGLAEFEKYLTSLKTPTEFSGAELLRIMATFQDSFEKHFHSEIDTIAGFADHPNAPVPGTPEAANASATFASWGKKTVTKAGTTDVVPFFLLNLDHTAEEGLWANWPPIPPPIKWGLINLAGAWHSGWWKFTSCTAAGQPKELYALQFAKKEDAKEEL